MANITPDLMQALQQGQGMGQSMDQPQLQVNPEEELRKLIEMLSQQSQQSQQQQMPQQMPNPNGMAPMPAAAPVQPDQMQLAQQLASQLMTGGLTNQQNTGATGFNYQGPVSGFTGPLRQSDVPSEKIATTMKPADAQKVDEENRLRGTAMPGFKNAGEAFDFNAATKGLPKDLIEQMARMHGIKVPESMDPILKNQMMLERQQKMFDYRTQNAPLTDSARKELQFAETLVRQGDIVGGLVADGTYKNFTGPMHGYSYDMRSKIGKTTLEEDMMQQALQRINNSETYMQSGMAINEAEALRIARTAPRATDDEVAFARRFRNWQTELMKAQESKQRLVGTTRGQAAAGARQPAAQPAGAAQPATTSTPEQRAQASQLVVKAKAQLGEGATDDQVRALARKMLAEQGKR